MNIYVPNRELAEANSCHAIIVWFEGLSEPTMWEWGWGTRGCLRWGRVLVSVRFRYRQSSAFSQQDFRVQVRMLKLPLRIFAFFWTRFRILLIILFGLWSSYIIGFSYEAFTDCSSLRLRLQAPVNASNLSVLDGKDSLTFKNNA